MQILSQIIQIITITNTMHLNEYKLTNCMEVNNRTGSVNTIETYCKIQIIVWWYA